MTNSEFAQKNEYFKKCCKRAGIEPTVRQASKFRNRKGLAYQHRHEVKEEKAA